MKIGDVVKIENCVCCPGIVGKTAQIKSFAGVVGKEEGTIELNFGRGRPLADRPKFISSRDVTLIKE